jgi:hypothetical protein
MKTFAIVSMFGLLLAAGTINAQQQQPAPARAPAQAAQAAPAAQGISPNDLLQAGFGVAQGMDRGQAGALWDDASPVAKQAVKREDFIAQIQKARQPLGAPGARNWIAVRRALGDGKAIPAGVYASVEFVTTFAQNRTMRELVSFRLEQDGVWRLSGYTVQP